jgi:hypothetical protein
MAGDSAQARYERNLETAIADDAREDAVGDVCSFELLASGAAAPLERAAWDRGYERHERQRTQTANALKVADFADESTSCDDCKANPEAPDNAAEDSNDFMAEELDQVAGKGRESGWRGRELVRGDCSREERR